MDLSGGLNLTSNQLLIGDALSTLGLTTTGATFNSPAFSVSNNSNANYCNAAQLLGGTLSSSSTP